MKMDRPFLRESGMKRAIVVALGVGAVITSAAAIGIASPEAAPRSVSRHQYQASLRAAEAAREAAAARCATLAEPAREVCRAEAAAEGLVRAAEIESSYRRDERSARQLQRARIEARHEVARAHCAALSGFRRDKCLVKAHAARGRALLEAAGPYEVRYNP